MLGNGQTRGFKAASLLASAWLGVLTSSPVVMAGPQGGAISAGSGSISQPNAAVTNVIQNTHRMAIDWQSFNLGASETVNFNQPSVSSAVLNRIHDQNPSQIFGAINANGRVFLANPNGIVFGQTATVNVGALIAAGMNISNADFMAGNYNFRAGENGAGVIVNRGLINAATGGSVGLLGSTVINEGIIVADYGNIELASGNRAVVNFDGDGLLNIQVSEDVINNAVENDAAVSNRGSLLADGGQVVLTAHAASDVFDNAINNEGIIRAARIDNTGGVIRLVGNSGTVLHSGEISARGENGSGGTVHVLGERVGLTGNASIDASGDSGGGTVLVGGDYQGQGSLQTASRTYVGSNAIINADAVEAGDGGQVVVWANEITRYYGSISSRGGIHNGNGGDVEVSGKQSLDFNGVVDVAAPNGTGGTLLLDPFDITISTQPTSDPPGTITDKNNEDVAFDDYDNSDLNINIVDVTGFNELFLQAVNNITLSTALTMTNADSSVRFEAGNDININAPLTVSGTGSITLTADAEPYDNSTGSVIFGTSGSATASGGDITINTGDALAIAGGGISNNTGNVILDAGGAITQTSAISANALTTTSDGGTTLTGNNAVSNFTATNSASGDVAMRTSGPLDIATGGISNNVGNVILNAGGAITQTGTISTNTLTTTSVGGATLTGNNTVSGFTATNTTGGDIALTNASGGTLSIIGTGISQSGGGDVVISETGSLIVDAGTAGIAGINAAGSKIELISNDITLNAALTGDTVVLRPFTPTTAISLGAGTGTELEITQSDINQVIATKLSLGASSHTGDINLNENIFFGDGSSRMELLTSGAGAVSGAGALDLASGDVLVVSAGSGIDLSGNNNPTVVDLSNNVAGDIYYNSSGNVEVSGLSNNVGNATLVAAGEITQTGVISTNTLNTSSNGNTTLGLDNSVASFTATNTSSTSGNIVLNTSGALDIAAGGISNNVGNVTLDTGGAITQTGSISTNTLTTKSDGGVTLTGSNTVGSFNATNINSGNVALTNASGGTLSIIGISQLGGGDVVISDMSVLSVFADIETDGGNISLFADTMTFFTDPPPEISAGSGIVTLSTNNLAREVRVGIAGTGTDSFLGITQAMLDQITTTGGVTIGSAAHTAGITVEGNTTTTFGGTLTLRTQGNAAVNANITAKDNILINADSSIAFDPGTNLTATDGDISLLTNGAITGDGALTIKAGDALNITQAMTTNGDTSLTASLMEITKNITVNGGFLQIVSDNNVTISPNITLTSGGRLSIEHPDDSTGITVATDAGANLTLRGASIYLPGALNVNSGNLSLNATASMGDLIINDKVSTTTSGDISIIAGDLVMETSGANITSAGTVTIADNGTGNGMLLASGQGDIDTLHISTNEYNKITATGLVLSSADLTIQESFNPLTSVPLTINATKVTIPQSNTQITLLGSLDFSDSIVSAGPGLAIDTANQFAMNNQLNVSGPVSIKAATDINMGLPSVIKTTNGQVDMITTGGDVLLGLIDVGNANVNVTASAGSILNNNGVFTDITRSEDNVRSANVTLDANQRIGVSSTDAITLNINREGLITLDFNAPKAFINNRNNTKIVNLGSGDVAIGFIFSSEIIGTGHYVGVNNERDPPASDADTEEAQQPSLVSVLGADYRAIPVDEQEDDEIISTLSPTVPVLIRTSRGWEFKAPSRSRQPAQNKGIRYIDW